MALKNPLAAPAASQIQLQQSIAQVLSSNQIGDWGSDHSQEAKSFQGWNYMAIAALGRLAAQAVPYVYAKAGSTTVGLRKSLKSNYKALWKSFAEDGAADTVPEEHWVSALMNRPNPSQSAELFQREYIQQMHLHGCCLIFNRPNKHWDRIAERYIVPMAITQPVYPGQYSDATNGGIRILAYAAGLGFSVHPLIRALAGCIVPVEWLSVIRDPDPVLRGDGKSATDAAGWWIDSAQMLDMARWKQLKRGPRPHGVVTVKGDSTEPVSDADLDRIEKRLNKKLGSEEYDERVIAVADGTIVPSDTTPKDMDYIEAFDQLGKTILAVHGVGKAAVGLTDNMTAGSLAAALSQSAGVAQSDMDMLAGDFTMLAKSYGEDVDCQYEVPAFDDPALVETRLQTDLNAGIRTVREWRAMRGLPPFGDWRDDARVTTGGLIDDQQPPGGSTTTFDAGEAGSAAGKPMSAGGGVKPFSITDSGVPEPGAKSLAKAYRKPGFRFSPGAPIVAVDLDGTLAEESLVFDPEFIGDPIAQKVADVRRLKDVGCQIIIFTCRESDELVMNWLDAHAVPWDSINAQPEGYDGSGKVYANIYWDNRALSAEDGLYELAQRLPDGPARERLLASIKPETEKFGCVMLEIPTGVAAMVSDEQALITADCLRGDGLESWPHVTVLYGIAGATAKEVIDAVRRIDQMDIVLGLISTFEKEDGTAILKIDVESPDLRKANARLKDALPVVETYPEYCPHLTLGVVDSYAPEASCGPYECSLSGRAVHVTHAIVAIDGQKYRVPLRQGEGRSGSQGIRFDAPAADYTARLARLMEQRDPLKISIQPVDVAFAGD